MGGPNDLRTQKEIIDKTVEKQWFKNKEILNVSIMDLVTDYIPNYFYLHLIIITESCLEGPCPIYNIYMFVLLTIYDIHIFWT